MSQPPNKTTREVTKPQKGRVFLIGVGPGDPGLLTITGKNLLADADVVVYDYLVSSRIMQYARADAELIYVGKNPVSIFVAYRMSLYLAKRGWDL